MRMRPRTLASVSGLALVIGCSVGKLFDSPPIKVIGVTPPWVVDSAPAGGDTTVPAALMISTTGGGQPRTWTAHRVGGAVCCPRARLAAARRRDHQRRRHCCVTASRCGIDDPRGCDANHFDWR